MSEKFIDIHVFGRLLKINCPNEQQEELKTAANDLENRLKYLKNKTGVSNTEQLIFITALNISRELSMEKLKMKNYSLHVKKNVSTLQNTIEQVLSRTNIVNHI